MQLTAMQQSLTPHPRAAWVRLPCSRACVVAMAVATLIALAPHRALAHSGEPPAPHDLWTSWSWEPLVLLGIALSGWLYARGVWALWHRAGVGRGVPLWQAAAFMAGLLTVFVALISPMDGLSASLFSAHMAQHLLLILVAAPLLVLGNPLLPFLWALPRPWRRSVGGWWRSRRLRAAWHLLTDPVVAWAVAAAALWVWHIPRLYDAALGSEGVHALEHGVFLGTALLYWWTVARSGRRGSLGYGAGLLSVFAMAVQSGALGALMTFASRPWYPAYAARTAAWGLTPLEDQQLGGLIMWVPAGAVYLLAAGLLFAGLLAQTERRMRLRERTAGPPGPAGSAGGRNKPAIPPAAGDRTETEHPTAAIG
jgi:putative membrane protein